MDLPHLAVAQELVFLGAALAVALLLVIQLRISKRFRTLDLEVQRLQKAHKDGSLDARSRVEDATRALEALEESVAPRLAVFEPHLIELGARVDALDARIAPLVSALEAAGRRETEATEILADAKARLEQAEEATRGVGERFGVLEEGIRDARDRLEQAERGLDRVRSALDARLGDIDRKVGALQTVPATAPRQPTRAALGLAERRAAGAGSHAVTTGGGPQIATGADESEHPEDTATGMRGVLIGVIVLAALTMLLHWMGVGR